MNKKILAIEDAIHTFAFLFLPICGRTEKRKGKQTAAIIINAPLASHA